MNANDCSLADGRVTSEDILHRARADVPATQDNHVLQAVPDVQAAVAIDNAGISCSQPSAAASDCFGRFQYPPPTSWETVNSLESMDS